MTDVSNSIAGMELHTCLCAYTIRRYAMVHMPSYHQLANMQLLSGSMGNIFGGRIMS